MTLPTVTAAAAVASSTGSSATSASFTPAVGEFIIVGAGGGSAGSNAVTLTITDSLGGTWTQRAFANKTSPGGAGGGGAAGWWQRVGAILTATAMTVTVTATGTSINSAGLRPYRVSGTSTLNFGTATNGSPTSGTTNITPTALTSTQASSLLLVATSEWTGGVTLSSSDLTLSSFSNANMEAGFGFRTITSIASQTFNESASGGGGLWYWAAVEMWGAVLSVSGSIAPAGTLTKVVNKAFAGSVTATGALAVLKVVVKVFSGSITATGAFAKRANKALAGSITPTGALTKTTAKKFAGSVTPAGVFAKAFIRKFTGSIATTGTLVVTPLGRVFGRPGRAVVRAVRAAEAIIRIRRT